MQYTIPLYMTWISDNDCKLTNKDGNYYLYYI